jgi:hypothetical protein
LQGNIEKTLCALLAVCVFSVLTGCAEGAAAPQNEISLAQPTGEQQEIIDIVNSAGIEMYLFDFSTKDAFEQAEFWVETYEKGVLSEISANLGVGPIAAGSHGGRLSIIINKDANFQLQLTVFDNGSSSSYRQSSDGDTRISIDPDLFRAFGPMNGTAAIEDGRDIMLYSSVFGGGNSAGITVGTQALLEQPGILEEYEYAQLLKCRFSNAGREKFKNEK